MGGFIEQAFVLDPPNKTLQPPIRAQRSVEAATLCSRGLRLNVEPLAYRFRPLR
jgi:hypothetical protein